MDDLMCNESVTYHNTTGDSHDLQRESGGLNMKQFPTVPQDDVITKDPRVLRNLVKSQTSTQPSGLYLQNTECNPSVRTMLVNWMLELCEHRNCEEQVFMTAVNILDRFLETTPVLREQLQLVACSCMLIASKLRQCFYLAADTLAYYTENTFTVQEIKQWEVLVLAKLSWNVCSVTSYDFLQPLLSLLPQSQHLDSARRHATTYVCLAAVDSSFVSKSPSIIAASAVSAAIESFTGNQTGSIDIFAESLRCSPSEISATKELLEVVLQQYFRNINTPDNNSDDLSSNSGFLDDKNMVLDIEDYKIDGKITPSDISDVEL